MEFSTQISAFIQVLIIDLSLAADNAIVIGAAAGGLPAKQRHRAVLVGLVGATILRIVLSLFAVQLMHVTGLVLAGGLLLVWVSWKMFRDLQRAHRLRHSPPEEKAQPAEPVEKKLRDAIIKILLADLGMSLDNILAVAGAARDHVAALVLGLVLSIVLTAVAATATAKLLHRFPWVGWLGVATVLYVAVRMVIDGIGQFT